LRTSYQITKNVQVRQHPEPVRPALLNVWHFGGSYRRRCAGRAGRRRTGRSRRISTVSEPGDAACLFWRREDLVL